MSLTIKCEVLPGDPIDSVVSEGLMIAKKLGVGVSFKYNGIKIIIYTFSKEVDVIKYYMEEINKQT